MFKNKLKKSLLKEYIEICQMQNYCSEKNINELKNMAQSLRKKYEQIFLKIGYIDLSFFILKNELQKTSGDNFECGFSEICKKIDDYNLSLQSKMKTLLFSEFEIGFIENFG